MRIAILLIAFLMTSVAQAGIGYNGQCPDLSGSYRSIKGHAPVQIDQDLLPGEIIVYKYKTAKGNEEWIADRGTRPFANGEGKMKVFCQNSKVIKAFTTAEGYSGQQTIAIKDQNTIALDGEAYKRVK
jgi:hypothetical protein